MLDGNTQLSHNHAPWKLCQSSIYKYTCTPIKYFQFFTYKHNFEKEKRKAVPTQPNSCVQCI